MIISSSPKNVNNLIVDLIYSKFPITIGKDIGLNGLIPEIGVLLIYVWACYEFLDQKQIIGCMAVTGMQIRYLWSDPCPPILQLRLRTCSYSMPGSILWLLEMSEWSFKGWQNLLKPIFLFHFTTVSIFGFGDLQKNWQEMLASDIMVTKLSLFLSFGGLYYKIAHLRWKRLLTVLMDEALLLWKHWKWPLRFSVLQMYLEWQITLIQSP